MGFRFTDAHLKAIRDWPHLLGHIMGKTLLTETHSGWIRHCWCAPEHVSLQGHRGSFKTTAITEVGPIWWLLFNPNDRVALFRKTFTEATATLTTIKRSMEQEAVRELFKFAHGRYPKFRVKRDNSLDFSFKATATKECSIDVFGINTSVTGRHYDKILCDDIVTLDDRLSKAERERTKEALRELITNVIDPGKVLIHAGTPWHKDDAWTITPNPVKFDCYTTGILTAEQIAQRRKLTTPSLFAANYELKHVSSEDALFSNLTCREPWVPKMPRVVAHVDAKFDGDHTAALTLMAQLPDGRIQVKGWVFTEHVKLKVAWIQATCKLYGVKELWVETNPDKGYTADLLASPMPDGTPGLRVRKYSENTNKQIKIGSFLLEFWDRLVWDSNCDESYISQVTDYREGQEPDDAPDSAASLLRQAFHSTAATSMELWKL